LDEAESRSAGGCATVAVLWLYVVIIPLQEAFNIALYDLYQLAHGGLRSIRVAPADRFNNCLV
jgi:hypothetical protein